MPLFNNRAGNAGTGKGILTNISHRRAAVQDLKRATRSYGVQTRLDAGVAGGGWQGASRASMNYSTPGNPFSPKENAFNVHPSEQLRRDKNAAVKAGLSPKKVTRIVNRTMNKAAKAGVFNEAEKAGRQIGGHNPMLNQFRGY